MKTEHKVFTASIFFGLIFWIIDGAIDFFLFYEGTFFDVLILKIPPQEIFIRTVNFGLFVLFGLLVTKVISKHRKIAGELHQYEHIVSSSTDMMALLDNQFKYLAANKTYLDAFNLTSEKLVGQTVSEIFGGKFFEEVIKPHAEKCLSGEEVNYQEWVEFPAFGKRYMDVTYSPYFGADNEVKGFVVNSRNITERRKAEEKGKRLLHDMGERVKELECIYGVTESLHRRQDLKEIFQSTLALIPPGWQYPEITRGKISFDGKEYVHEPFKETNWKQSSDIIVGKRSRGSVEVYYLEEQPELDEGPFMKEERHLIDGIAHALGKAIERIQAEEESERSHEELQKLTTHLQTVREEERTLVAHELHDDIGQALSALKMDIYMLEKKLPKDQNDISDQLKETNDLLDKTIQTTRKIYSELRPTLIEHFSIKEVLEDLLITFKESNNFSGDTNIDLKGIELKEEHSIAIYRIVQEALNNIRWHSNAKTVNVGLKKTKNHLELTIKDDGIGIKEEDLNKSNSFGIIGMKERTNFLGGEIEFKGIPEKGTILTVTIPLNPENA